MIKFVVVWLIVVSTFVGYDATPDPYTGQFPMAVPAVARYETHEELKTKTFDSKKEAEDFISKAPENIRKGMKLIELEPVNASGWAQERQEPVKRYWEWEYPNGNLVLNRAGVKDPSTYTEFSRGPGYVDLTNTVKLLVGCQSRESQDAVIQLKADQKPEKETYSLVSNEVDQTLLISKEVYPSFRFVDKGAEKYEIILEVPKKAEAKG